MRVNLQVPYSEKDAAKKKGARWDPAQRVWYVIDKENLRPFLRWMPTHLRRAHKPKKEKIPEVLERLEEETSERFQHVLEAA